jgi:iron complex transport system substrate-binding protein
MLELVGAINAFKNEPDVNGWLSLSEEVILSKNPDVILVNISYIPDIVNEIKARPGWDSLNAVQNNAVYYIDANASSRPTQNIVQALDEIAKAVYPDKYK